RPSAPGLKRHRAAALPNTPCPTIAAAGVVSSGDASTATGRNAARSLDEIGLDPVVGLVDVATSRRFAVPEHDALPGGTQPAPPRPAGRRGSRPAPRGKRAVG